MKRHHSAAEAIEQIKSGQRVFLHGGAATPNVLIKALVEQADRLRDVELIHIHTHDPGHYGDIELKKSFRVVNLFVGSNMRPRINYDHNDYLPIFLSEIPQLFRSRKRPINVAMVQLSPPDKHGFCSLGVSVDVSKAAVESADMVIAQINPRMPRVHGDGIIHISHVDHYIEVDQPLHAVPPEALTEEEKAIGRNAASLIEDGATLQAGIGSIPNAVLEALVGHKHLGIHTEMWSDGALKLIKCGAVDNSRKSVHPGKTVSGFVIGSQELYDFVHDNPSVVNLVIDYVNNPATIKRNPRVTAINSAVEVDLTGQVCADSIGPNIISGVGGQMDFMRGAALSPGGKPILALTSRTTKGIARIVPTLKLGAGVVTTRAHVHYVVTEHGIADLFGKTLNERARALISIAHPADREFLDRQWHEIHKRVR
ncbi:MAG: 4-hydroxybutyrate CoA-transferase [Oligoflexia bacterium]|nr:4-hydroxybutyrate CoA-transferase [Oligoflexia bacterium]